MAVTDIGIPDGVQPEVRVLGSVVVACLTGGADRQVGQGSDVERGVGGLGADGIVHGRLETPEVDHDLGPAEVPDGARGELQVVRLRSGPGEVGDVTCSPPIRAAAYSRG